VQAVSDLPIPASLDRGAGWRHSLTSFQQHIPGPVVLRENPLFRFRAFGVPTGKGGSVET